jgi:tetratricopeptide (TPR) repeat protein
MEAAGSRGLAALHLWLRWTTQVSTPRKGSVIIPRMHIRTLFAALLIVAFVGGTAHADQNDPELNGLFGDLQTAEAKAADDVQQKIWSAWHKSGSETVDLLMLDASEAIQLGLHEQAEAQYDAVVDLAPAFSEGWNRRATLRFMRGNYNGSIEDIVRVLELEPRHFGALAGLGMIYDRLNQPEAALKSFEQALLINPHMAEVKIRVEALTKQIKDRDI